MDRNELIAYLNQYLAIDDFEDFCQNGLQVEGKSEIKKITVGVSVSERLFNHAVQNGSDMILVHHGLFWKNDPIPYRATGYRKRRLSLLLQNDINLVAYHLPLDAHPEVGNNIQILKQLQIPPLEAMEVGFVGFLRHPIDIHDLTQRVNDQLNTDSTLLNFGKDQAEKIFVMSGSSSSACEKISQLDVDTFLGGNIKEEHVRVCEELGLNFIAAGHYNTEKFGVQALGHHIQEKFNLEMQFVDIPNPI